MALTPSRMALVAGLFVLPFVWMYPFLRYLESLSPREALKVMLVVAAIGAYFWLRFGFFR